MERMAKSLVEHNSAQTATCPECGGSNCRPVFDEFLALEFTDPGYGAVHHLTVATYMLQHSSKLSRAGWLEMRRLLREFLVENKSPLEVRRKNKSAVDGGKRKWKTTSCDDLPKISKVKWAKTILDVRAENAALYCADVQEWAKAALFETEQVQPDKISL